MNLPNILTISRFVLTVLFIYFIMQAGFISAVIAAVLFGLASLTDYFDGYYAKKYSLITNFGKIMDPVADKFLILSAFFIFMKMDIVVGWMVWVICAREVIVTAMRLWAMKTGAVLAAEQAGKVKTVFQIVTILTILAFIILQQSPLYLQTVFGILSWFQGIYILMVLTVGITLFSGVACLWNNRKNFF
ncbi:MAG: CDP-diacylglycerol--glycerol-3-phosphate 3-phosphatidyltransferase [Candidatus Omnitrophica bacterium]|nr:CDP-diacylglycerol--glycerol-3-phosphate 3-phosphatidyltransferase [Candidatus Omnitrophota bacterium]